jgi:hypothetical protein
MPLLLGRRLLYYVGPFFTAIPASSPLSFISNFHHFSSDFYREIANTFLEKF